ncbi:phasin family protein [Marinobacter xestospongiae]|uniref:Phasin family protein n=1 Tax=Marinobacter xestospongiae TaxID=994319 RepID=A0ABU3VTW8_9GAMM|nr:phasin family protein [Marinobacter xestospongiae]MDV2077713.1 phasin family protein [Marinobacter xestospongiae]
MFTDSFKFSSEPMTRVNKLMMDTCEGVVEAQMASLKGYLGLIEEQTRAAASIRDVDGVKGFVESQPERFNQLVNRVSEDFQQFSKVAEDFRNEASQLFQESAASNADDSAEAKPEAPAKTTQKKTATPAS